MMQLSITKPQHNFINATADEVLFGGAAGGGKSYGQIIDALIFALKYPGSKQIILRRTYPELEKSIIRQSLAIYPKSIYKYTASNHTGLFTNGSIIDFGYCDSENDVYRYQSAEFDVIRFDELTHFTKQMYLYLISRLRGANNYPKQVKSTTNPGGVGHTWVKERFIDVCEPYQLYKKSPTTRIFLPANVQDNKFLMEKDKGYVKRLENLSEKDKKALLYGRWDIYQGQFFTEWNPDVHVITPIELPKSWRRYITLDYGLDMLAAYFIAVDNQNNAYVYNEVYCSDLIISSAADKIKQCINSDIVAIYAPPDLWNRRQETGRSAAELFAANGLALTKAANDRRSGWFAVKEYLKIYDTEMGKTSRLKVFSNCINIIRTLPALTHSDKNPNDVSNTPHEYTHAPDALRYFCTMNCEANADPYIYNNYSADIFESLTF